MESNSISSSSSNSSSISEISSFSMNSSPNSRALFEEPKVRDYKIENEQLRNKITTDFISSDQVFLKRKQYICSACAAKISLVVGRWNCAICKDYHLCSQCYFDQEVNQNFPFNSSKHQPTHTMVFESTFEDRNSSEQSNVKEESLDEETMENFRFILSKLKKPSHHQVVKENDKAFTHREPRASRTSRWFGKYIAKSSFYVSYSTSRRINWIISISLICFILFSLWILKWGQYWNFFNSSNSLSKTKPTSHYQFIWWELLLKEKVENQSFNLELTANKLSSMIPEHSNCENTIQTKIYVTDSKGHSCLREELDNFQCCPKNSPQYSCNACKGDCCTQFENCVSCCLNPSKIENLKSWIENSLFSSLLKEQKPKSDSEEGNGVSASISLSNFELCSALCRKSSKDLIEHQKIHTEFCFDLKTLNDTIKLRKENNFEITKGSLRIQ